MPGLSWPEPCTPVQESSWKLFIKVQEGKDLAIMDLVSSDPYVKVWHQDSEPRHQLRRRVTSLVMLEGRGVNPL